MFFPFYVFRREQIVPVRNLLPGIPRGLVTWTRGKAQQRKEFAICALLLRNCHSTNFLGALKNEYDQGFTASEVLLYLLNSTEMAN